MDGMDIMDIMDRMDGMDDEKMDLIWLARFIVDKAGQTLLYSYFAGARMPVPMVMVSMGDQPDRPLLSIACA